MTKLTPEEEKAWDKFVSRREKEAMYEPVDRSRKLRFGPSADELNERR